MSALWMSTVDQELDFARRMFHHGRYMYACFMCHVALEKCLKARLSRAGHAVPEDHDLVGLIGRSDVSLTPEEAVFVETLNRAHLMDRASDELPASTSDFSEAFAAHVLRQTEHLVATLS